MMPPRRIVLGLAPFVVSAIACAPTPRGASAVQAATTGTSADEPRTPPSPVSAESRPTLAAPPEVGRRTFGAPVDPGVPAVPLAEIAAHPDRYRDQTVRTHGAVVRVCQRMGCWMEMSADGAPTVRVPMGGHAFFLPRDSVGRRVEVQGLVRTIELSEEARAHLASEGATEVTSALSIDATGVVVVD